MSRVTIQAVSLASGPEIAGLVPQLLTINYHLLAIGRIDTRTRPIFSEDSLTLIMPKKETMARARRDQRAGKSTSTQAGEFVREEIEAIRKGEHGARSTKQAIAIGLSKARRAGVKLPVPKRGSVPEQTRRKAMQDLKKGESEPNAKPSKKRSQAALKALKREGRAAASKRALSRHARAAARKRSRAERSASARKAARTRGDL